MLSDREKKLMLEAFSYGLDTKYEVHDQVKFFYSWLDEAVDSQGGTVEMLLDFDFRDKGK